MSIRFPFTLEKKFRGGSPFKIAIIKTGQFPVLSKFSALGERPFDVSSAINFTRVGGPRSFLTFSSNPKTWHETNRSITAFLSLSPSPFLFLSLSLASVYNWVCSCEHGLRKLNGTRSSTSYNQNCKISYAETDREGYCSSSF